MKTYTVMIIGESGKYETVASGKVDNNEQFTAHITRAGKTYTHTVIVKDHQTVVNADTGNETHTLSLTKRGI